MEKLQSRYVGARPFEIEQQLIFRGRQSDTEGVFRLIQLETLVVLYGKSGTGKSSLLNAGIIPKVKSETDLEPIRVRFNAYKEGNVFTPPLDTTRLYVRGNVAQHDTFLDKLISNEATLWHDVKEHFIRHKGEKGLLLVIDQFEELFTYPAEMVSAFQEQLAEALFKAVPQRYWDKLQADFAEGKRPLSIEELNLFQSKSALKVVLSIRSDRLHLLNRLDEQLPTILKNLYELDALNDVAARQAIEEPAAMPQMGIFDTAPFLYETAALNHILDFLSHERKMVSEADDDTYLPTRQKIEATQLQIICDVLEKRVKANQLSVVKVSDVGNLEAIIEQYYDNQIKALDAAEQLPARRLVEEGLVFEEEERRLSLYEGQIFKTYKINPDTLQKLVDSHLLRAEPSLSGGYTYELSHDTLVAPVLKAKNVRLDAERKIAEAEAAKMREVELEEARAQAIIEKRRRGKATILAIVTTALFFFSAFATYIAYNAQQNAKYAELLARYAESSANESRDAALRSDSLTKSLLVQVDSAKKVAETKQREAEVSYKLAKAKADEAQRNLEAMQKERAAKNKAEVKKYLNSAQRMIEMKKYVLARQILQEALSIDKSNKEVLDKLKEIDNY
jgi:energy-coupling factor transporter ATP-binding protein EcfA2